jgi:hypothetical protein
LGLFPLFLRLPHTEVLQQQKLPSHTPCLPLRDPMV